MAANRSEDILEVVARGDLKTLQYLVEEKRVPLNQINEQNQTVAHVAIENDHLTVLEYLLLIDKSLLRAEDCVGNRPLHMAVEKDNLLLVKFLVEEYSDDIFWPIGLRLGNTAVHLAVQTGSLPILQYFIEERYANYNLRNQLGESLLFIAAEKQHLHIVKYLVERWNADVNMLDNNQQNILFVSAKVGDLFVPRYLLDERNVTSLDVNKRDLEGRTILYYAAALGWLDFIRYFVEEKNANFNIPDFQRMTPLHVATLADNLKVVMYLVDRKSDPEAQDISGKTPLDLATDEKVTWYLKRATHQRMVRSISKSSNEYTPECQQISIADDRTLNGFSFENKVRFLDAANVTFHQPSHTNGFYVNGFLSLVNAFMRRHTEYRLHWSTSPEKIIQTRIDPVAITTLNNTDKFSDVDEEPAH